MNYLEYLKSKRIFILKWLFSFVFIFGCLGLGVVYGYVTSLVNDEPIRTNEEILKAVRENIITSYVYYNDHSLVGQVQSGEDRKSFTMDQIPMEVKNAFIATEDDNFISHLGVDMMGTLRAVTQKLSKAEVQTGGSTITQQLARRVFLSADQTNERKAKEILLAIRMERILSKDEILFAYLTKIYFGKGSDGNNLYGLKSAASGLFEIDDLKKLNLAQAAYIAGLPQQPSSYSAFDNKGIFDSSAFSNAVKRQQFVLKRMTQEEMITKEQYKKALSFDLKESLSQTKPRSNESNPFLMTEVEQRAAKILLKLKHSNIKTGGYKIYTTIDPIIYYELMKIAGDKQNFTDDHPEKGVEQIGAIMIDNHNGGILAMIPGRDFHIEQLNHATQMVRQPGSAMKPIAAYLPALDEGLIQPASIIDDVPIILEDGEQKIHIPRNWDDKYHGLVTVREALKWSYNIPALKLFNYKVGINEAWAFTRSLGITTLTEVDNEAKTGVIGGLTHGVSVEELTNAYASIGNRGVFNDAHMISKIENAKGELIYEHHSQPKRVFSAQTAYLMTDMLVDVVTSGTAADLRTEFKHQADIAFAGKTGSTQNDVDAWFVGYTPDITTGVWAGYDQPQFKLTKTDCSKTAGCGTLRAKKIWAKIMDVSFEKKQDLFPTIEFTKPEGIVSMTVSKYSGDLPSQEIQNRNAVVFDLFNQKYIPNKVDDIAKTYKYTIYNQKKYAAKSEMPKDMVFEEFLVLREKPIFEMLSEIKTSLAKFPDSGIKPLSYYIPIDSKLDAPVEMDPRIDDGHAPSAPLGVTIKSVKGNDEISFQLNSESDVAGYRIYRSSNGKSFKYLEGKPVVTQSEARFTVENPISSSLYVITAVDIVGQQSKPSDIVLNRKDSIEEWFSDFFKKRK